LVGLERLGWQRFVQIPEPSWWVDGVEIREP
jgi:hypothetical protein